MAGVRIRSRFTLPRPFNFRKIDQKLTRRQRLIGEDAELILAANAPKESGKLARSIRATRQGGDVVVVIEARDERGFDYVAVTRFGHRQAFITPKVEHRAKYPRVATKTRRPVRSDYRAALKFTFGGRTVFASSVRRYKPADDWVERSIPAIRQKAKKHMGLFAREVEIDT